MKYLIPFIYIFIVSFFLSNSLFGQTFQKTYGGPGNDEAQYVIKAEDGGYIVAGGITNPFGSSMDAFLMKINDAGEQVWLRTYGGIQKDLIMAVIAANDGGYVAIGETWSTGKGGQDVFIMKTDVEGKVAWCKTFGGNIDDFARGIVAIKDGYIFTGPEYSIGLGGLETFVIRLDNAGNVIYSRTVGASNFEQFQVGYVEGSTMYCSGGMNGNAVYLTLDLETCQIKTIKSFGGGGNEALYKILPTKDGNFIIADHTWSTTFSTEMREWVMKISRDGTPIWSKVYGSTGNNFRGPIDLAPGGYIVTPWDYAYPNSSDATLLKLDEDGNVVWASKYGGNSGDRFFWTLPTDDGGYLAVGQTRSFGAGGEDLFIVKTDAKGLVGSCCPANIQVESSTFNSELTPPSAQVGNFAPPINWNLQTGSMPIFVFDKCSYEYPVGYRSVKLCKGEKYAIKGKEYLAPTVVRDTLKNIVGCDSIIEYTLALKPLPNAEKSFTICSNGSVTYNNKVYTVPGIYQDTLIAANSCDTAVSITILSKPFATAQKTFDLCNNTTITINGKTYKTPGLYVDTLKAAVGCDTIFNITLLPKSNIPKSISQAICPGRSITLYNKTYAIPGLYQDTLKASTGCDTAVAITILTKPYVPAQKTFDLCAGKSVTINGITYNKPGIYLDTLSATTGCDTALAINILAKPYVAAQKTFDLCAGKSLTINGITYDKPGVYLDTLKAAAGCDTAFALTLIPKMLVSKDVTQTICPGGKAIVNGTVYQQAGIFKVTIPASVGCDTLMTVMIVQSNDTLFSSEARSICPGDTVIVRNKPLYKAGDYVFYDKGISECISKHVVKISEYPKTQPVLEQQNAGCNGQPIGQISIANASAAWETRINAGAWTKNTSYDKLAVGTYQIEIKDANGCKSTHKIEIVPSKPLAIWIELDTTFVECGLSKAEIFHDSKRPVSIQWTPPSGVNCPTCPVVELRPSSNQSYKVVVTDDTGCTATAAVSADAADLYHIYVPNVFSPNDDGLNDRFTLYGSTCVTRVIELSIYDRWGNHVFQRKDFPLDDESKGWDGRLGREDLDPGVFTWWADLQLLQGRTVRLKGSVTIVK